MQLHVKENSKDEIVSMVPVSKNKPTDAHCLISHAQPLLS